MILIASADDLLKARVAGAVGPARSVMTVEDAVEAARRRQPRLVLLDVRLGGNRGRAVDAVPAVRKVAPLAKVAILTPRPTPEEVTEAVALGAYTYADTMAPDFEERVKRIAVVVSATGRRIPIARLR